MIPLHTAEQIAHRLCTLLEPACMQLMIVGSVRRRKAHVKDIEIVARAKPAKPVFGEKLSAVSALELLVARLVRERELAQRPDPKERKDGAKYKTLWLPTAGGVGIDLFIADPSGDNWGNTVAYRTGDWEFSRQLVTKRSAGGLMPKGFLHHDGYLMALGGARIACPTEEAFFGHLGIFAIPDPTIRDLRMAERLRGKLATERKVTA